MDLGHQLKELRKKKGISQENLANVLGVSRQAVYKWENNKGYPDIENLIRLSDYFEVTIDEIIRKDPKFQKNIHVGENRKTLSQFSDAGFYVGLILLIIGGADFFEQEVLGSILQFFGVAILIFYEDLLYLIKDLRSDFKEIQKD